MIWYCSLHCEEISIYVFLEKELRGLSPNFHIHVSVSNLYIPIIGSLIFCSRIGRPIVGIYVWITHRNMNVGIRTEAAQFLFWEHLLRILVFFAVHIILFQGVKAPLQRVNKVLYKSELGKCGSKTLPIFSNKKNFGFFFYYDALNRRHVW